MKKYVLFIFIFFLILVSFITNLSAKDQNILKNKIILLDIGHGNKDPGTVYGDVYEKNLNLEIGLKLKSVLEKNGAKVLMTRDGDYDLASPGAIYRKKSDFDNRIKIINNSEADIYLSIHINYLNDASVFGPEVYYNNDENKKVADVLQKTLNKSLNTNRKVKKIPSDTYMYHKLRIPGVLIECGFLSNRKERENLQNSDYQEKLATAIKEGIILYFT